VSAQFNPQVGQAPTPNDLLLTQPVSSIPGLSPAEAELIQTFQNKGGFPNDQEAPVTISFQSTLLDGGAGPAPQLDFTTFTSSTFGVALLGPGAPGPVPLDPPSAADYVVNGNVGTLTLHHQGHLPWAPGEYVAYLRSGPNGLKTVSPAQNVNPSQIFYLVAQGQDLTQPQNLQLLTSQLGSQAAAMAAAVQLNGIIKLFQQTGAFTYINTQFPQQELAIAATFKIAPTHTQVQLDPNRGLVPLPIDLLRNPGDAGTLTTLAACTFASGTLNDAGVCSTSAAAGFAALDGFSTTGAILAPTSDLIQIATVTPKTVLLYDLTNPTQPALVDPSTYIDAPCEFASTCASAGLATALSSAVALQPAGGTAADPSSVFRTKPLKDATNYAVVISSGVLDKTGASLQPGTAASILQFTNPLVDSNGNSLLVGVGNANAGALEVMRQQLVPVLAAATATSGVNAGKLAAGQIAMAYTFRTQTILSTALELAALPYASLPGGFNADGGLLQETAAAAFDKYGVDKTVVPATNIGQVLEADLTTLNLLNPATGAFFPDPSQASPETIHALITVPASVMAEGAALHALDGGIVPAPLVVFRHGLGGGRGYMLTVADAFAAQGFIVAAIDAAKGGDRSFCTSGSVDYPGTAVPQCAAGAACVTPLPAGAQGDSNPPGGCPTGFAYLPVSATCLTTADCPSWTGQEGVPVVSGNYLVSANFFRTRDTFRQDLIDESQLIHVLAAPPPTTPGPTGNPVFDFLASEGVIVNPLQVSYVGQSLGSIQGAANVATNPRISSAVLNVGGGTVTDIFTNSPAFMAQVDQLLAGMGIAPGTSAYLQFLVIAKMVLDPGDPINFADHVTANPLPDLLHGGLQAPKAVLTQAAFCDQEVPNPFNFLLDSNLGTGPQLIAPGFGAGTGTFQLFASLGTGFSPSVLSAGCSATNQSNWVPHGFITNWTDPTITGAAQLSAATFLADGGLPPSLVVLP
jgi:hypothetical protein